MEGDEIFLESLKAAGVQVEELRAWYTDLCDTSYWVKNGASEHSLQIATSLHQNTWAAVDGSCGCSVTDRVLMLSIALLAVLTSSLEKHAMACVVAWCGGMLLPRRNHSHSLRKSALT